VTGPAGRSSASGVIAAALTPMRDDLAADADLLAEHCRLLLNAGCSGIVVLGTTGEANSFTLDERERILARLPDSGIAPAALMVGTGCCAVSDAARLTKHALSLGVERVLLLPPFYYRGVSDDGLFAALAQTIEAVADPRLRVYLYQIPQNTGVEFSVELIERLLRAYPGVIAGIKDSCGEWPATQALCARFGERLDVLVGSERFLLRALGAGAAGCVTASANVNATAIAKLYAARGDPAAPELQSSVTAWRSAIETFPLIAALKEIVARRSGIERWRNVRPPLCPLPARVAQALDRRLQQAQAKA